MRRLIVMRASETTGEARRDGDEIDIPGPERTGVNGPATGNAHDDGPGLSISALERSISRTKAVIRWMSAQTCPLRGLITKPTKIAKTRTGAALCQTPTFQPSSVTNRTAAMSELVEERPLNPMRVFVHLAHDKDPDVWRAASAAGTLVGRNDETPYGYGRASSMGCAVEFSRSCPTSAVTNATRLAVRFALGFDLVHAIRQYNRIFASDIVWTHTESQFLAVSSLLRQRSTGPKLIGQAVWLFDRWPRLTLAHKALFRRLIERVDVLTTHSPLNAEAAQRLFPGTRVEVVRYGIPFENPVAPLERSNRPVRVVAVGNDRHRDWSTLVKALSRMEGVELEILSGRAPRSMLHGTSNVSLRRARTNLELSNAYARSTVAVVPLLPNLHASGITAIQEAVLAGVPVIATDVGGLRSYFGDNEIIYVPPGDTAALRDAVTFTALRGEESRDMVKRAQARIVNGGVNVQAYIERHVELSEELLGRAPRASVSSSTI